MPLQVRAVNTAADSENKIHDDAVAAGYGFRGGLVPGVTVYGYLAAAALEHFGEKWLDRGAMNLRLLKPVYENDEVNITLAPLDRDRVRIDAGESAAAEAAAEAWIHSESPGRANRAVMPLTRQTASLETLIPGATLGTLRKTLDLSQSKMSAPLDSAIGPDRLAHPAILLSLANEILVSNYQLGPWMHTASEVRKFSSARDGDSLSVQARIESCFERKGHQFVVLDVVILREERVVEQIGHTAIWRPRKL